MVERLKRRIAAARAKFDTGDTDQSLDDLAALVTTDIMTYAPDEIYLLILPLVRDELRKMRRKKVRRSELAAGREADPLAGIKDFLAQNVWTPNGYVGWGAATIQEHELAAAHWQAESEQLAERAALHLRAADEIRAAGVTCLDEIGPKPRHRAPAKSRRRVPVPV